MSHLHFALRSLLKTPAMTIIAIVTLALGIGTATTSFSAINALLYRPLPFIQNPERMLYVNEAVPSRGIDGTDVSYADFLQWRKRTETLAAIWVMETRTIILSGRTHPVRFQGTGLNAGAFTAMGVQPLLGRDFSPEDDKAGAAPTVILGHGVWQRHFAGDMDIVGRVVTLNNEPTTVVGVMPAGWRYPETSDLWVPLRAVESAAKHGNFSYDSHAMLKPGVSLDEARAEFATISAALAREFPATNEGLVAVLRPVREEATEDSRRGAFLIFGAVLFVFLISCANVVNLLLVRGSTRGREIAVRLALGASRGQIVRQLLLESLLLGLAGGIAGLLVGFWCLDLMVALIPVEIPFWLRFEFDTTVYLFAAGLSVLGSMLVGIAPALHGSRPQLIEELKEGGRSATGGGRGHRLRQTLVVVQIALALILLVGAGLTMRSFLELRRVDPGFDPSQVLTFRVGFPSAMKPSDAAVTGFYHELTRRLTELPGVKSAAAVSALPGIGNGGYSPVLLEGQPVPANFSEVPTALVRIITPGYFEVLHIPVRQGRAFADTDTPGRPTVAVVDESFVARYFPGQDPIGKRFRTGENKEGMEDRWLEIVGVVAPTRRWFDRGEPIPGYYVAQAQHPSNFMSVAFRVAGDPNGYGEVARQTVLAVNSQLPIYHEQTLERAIANSESMWRRRFFGSMFTVFAGIAVTLAAIGIYGVMAHAVSQRTSEIGIRMALGAQTRDILAMVVRRGLGLVFVGLAIGLVGAWATAHLLTGTLYGVSPHDPPTFATVPVLLAAVALLACIIPARRAAKIDPMVALRSE
jgi:putative ABC transport system permease protein